MILAFDVTGKDTLVAYLGQDSVIHSRRLTGGKATQILLPELEALREGRPLTALGVVKGPGSFTGIRIGLATAMGYASGAGIPVFGFSTFQLIAHHKPEGRYLAVLPAGRGRAFAALIEAGEMRGSIQMYAFEDLPQSDPLVVLEALPGVAAQQLELDHVALAVSLMANGPDPTEYDLEPLYVKPPDAVAATPLLDKLLGA